MQSRGDLDADWHLAGARAMVSTGGGRGDREGTTRAEGKARCHRVWGQGSTRWLVREPVVLRDRLGHGESAGVVTVGRRACGRIVKPTSARAVVCSRMHAASPASKGWCKQASKHVVERPTGARTCEPSHASRRSCLQPSALGADLRAVFTVSVLTAAAAAEVPRTPASERRTGEHQDHPRPRGHGIDTEESRDRGPTPPTPGGWTRPTPPAD